MLYRHLRPSPLGNSTSPPESNTTIDFIVKDFQWKLTKTVKTFNAIPYVIVDSSGILSLFQLLFKKIPPTYMDMNI